MEEATGRSEKSHKHEDAILQVEHEEGAAEISVARGFGQCRTVAESIDEAGIRHEAGRPPALEAPKRSPDVGIESEQLVITFLRTHAHAIGRIKAEDARLHVA